MASSMLSGDRRWAPGRKGMTVLGKVPKPINLPSQRLENHGLDPNVEIVPKGTLTWGSRPSPTTPNAWGLSNHSSPNADGSVDSSTHFNGRPSSSGSGTRPSTAGSDHHGEHVVGAWKSNSRPSSASGLLVSNQTPLAARPQSAETRPGSSHLSRFADSATGHSGPWGSAGTTQKMGPAYSGSRDFSLSSGEFPTLGSEKNSEPHNEPGSHRSTLQTPSTVSIEKNRLEITQSGTETTDVHSDKGNINRWKSETPSNTGDASASMDSWHGNPHNTQLATNVHPAQALSNPWHGNPQSPSDGVWYQGVSSGGTYRPPSTVPSDHMPDPFTRYPSQIPVRLDSNSHCAPRAGGHPTGGYQNESGEGFQPHPSSEPFMVPSMPIIPVRPGMYRGPVPYDAHYAPAGFGGPNVRERSVMGFAPGLPVYGQFPNQNFHQGPVRMPHRPSGPALLSDEKLANSRQHEIASGQYKVLLKHHNHPVGTDSHGNRNQATSSTTISLEKSSNGEVTCGQVLQQKVMKDGFTDHASGETMHSNGLQGCSQETVPANLPEKLSGRTGDNLIDKSDSSTASLEVNHLTTKNSKLIEKIETLNYKTRVTDCHSEGPSTKDDKTKKIVNCNPTHDNCRKSVSSSSSFGVSSSMEPPILNSISHGDSAVSSRINTLERRSAKAHSIPSETHASTFSMSGSSDGNTKAHADQRRRTSNMQGKGDHFAKCRMDGEVNNQLTKQLPQKDSLVSPDSNINYNGLPTEEFSASQDHSNSLGSLHMDNKPIGESYAPSSLDSVDYKAQRAKMKEIAMQRAKQLQQEEEERNREQKAKALAKLEELNRRTLFEISNKDADQNASCHQNLQSGASRSPPPDTNMDLSSSSETMTENNACGSTSHGVEVMKTSGDVQKRHDGTTIPIPSESDGNYSDKATLKHKHDLGLSNLEDSNPPLAGQLPNIDSSKVNASDTGKIKGTVALYLNSQKERQYSGVLPPSAVGSKTGPTDSLKKNSNQYQDNSSSKKRQVGHRRKHNDPEERNLEDKAAPADIAGSETVMEVATETALYGKSASLKSTEAFNPPTQQGRNESSSNKNKNKSEVALGNADSMTAVQAKGILAKPAEISQLSQKVSEDEFLLPVSKHEKTGISENSGEITGSSDQGLTQAAGGFVKATNHWKSNPSRRLSRNGQSRPGDKFQGNENAVWTPVKPSKGEPAGESQSSQCNAHVISNSSTGSTGNDIPGNVKSKRAELQRYVPKVVVKDAPQPDNLQILNCQTPVGTAGTDNVVLYDSQEDGFTKSDSVSVRKNAEHVRNNRHGRSGASASWRQRSSQDRSLDAAAADMHLSDHKQQEDAPSSSHVGRSSDIPMLLDGTPKEPVGVSNLKEQGSTNRSRRQIQKAHKAVLADAKDFSSDVTGKFEVQSAALDSCVTSAAAEGLNPVERAKSHWKPKSRIVSSQSIQQDTGPGGEKVASQTTIQDKESPIVIDQHARSPDKIIRGKAADMDERCHQLRKERKELVLENHNDRAGHNGERYQELPSLSPEGQQHGIQQMKGRDMRYGGRFHKGQDNSHGDTGRQNFLSSGDRQRQTSHFEYQRMEARNSSDHFQPVASSTRDLPTGSAATGPKFREKAQGHKKGGPHFYVRSTASYQDGKTSGRQS